MKKQILLSFIAAIAVVISGCKEKSESEKLGDAMQDAGKDAQRGAEKVGDAAKDAANDLTKTNK
jgi:hypothetical protein